MLDYVTEKFCGLVRKPAAVTLATRAMQRDTVRAATRAGVQGVVTALAVARQVDFNASEWVGTRFAFDTNHTGRGRNG
jgi:hypothetical protein